VDLLVIELNQVQYQISKNRLWRLPISSLSSRAENIYISSDRSRW